MKKLTLSIGLVAAILSAKAQDTTCTYFKGKKVYEFDYQMDTILHEQEQTTKFFDIEVKYGNTLCLDLSDDNNRVRKVITTFFDGTKRQDILWTIQTPRWESPSPGSKQTKFLGYLSSLS